MADTGFFTSYIDKVALNNWVNNPHSACLMSDMWMADRHNHSSVNHIPPQAIISSAPLENRQVEAGVMMADSVTFPNAAGAKPIAIVIKDDATGDLVLIDVDTNGLNIDLNGNDLVLEWNSCGIAQL